MRRRTISWKFTWSLNGSPIQPPNRKRRKKNRSYSILAAVAGFKQHFLFFDQPNESSKQHKLSVYWNVGRMIHVVEEVINAQLLESWQVFCGLFRRTSQ